MRCSFVNLNNSEYVKYHDEEWGRVHHDEHYLYEMFILELFQAGLSWQIILNKRSSFERAYDNFDINKVIKYDDKKVNELLNNRSLIRNRLKIKASISNSIIFKRIEDEYGSFDRFIWSYTNGEVLYLDYHITHNDLSDRISRDLKKMGMKFVGSVTIYSYLQAIGVINSHDKNCFCYKALK